MIAFPLGGVAAGSVALGGRGQLRDWEIFNRPNKGFRPSYAFPSIWMQAGNEKPVARVLESRILPPYEGQDGLGSNNVPGLSRLEGAVFTGEYPLAHIDFEDRSLPVTVALDAFSPFIPHEPDDSGLPVAVFRYTVKNPGHTQAKVSVAFSLDNPIRNGDTDQQRINTYRSEAHVQGLLMQNTTLTQADPMSGTIALAAVPGKNGTLSYWTGWPAGRWWNSPLLFWDQFTKSGELGAQPDPHNSVAALCVQQTIAAGGSAEFLFLLGWHFPNRTPDWIGWDAPPGEEKTVIGNYYATRFHDAWQAVVYTSENLERLEAKTRLFADALRSSTLPAAVKDAASANLSTLATTTCFRTADGEFHGFEGSDDTRGCCFGNCTHVWNYETVTPFLFPSFARSLRRSAFGYSMDDVGAIHFRQTLPDGKSRWGFAAADGQMGQIVHAWLDWKLSGDNAWLHENWPRIKKALEFAWIQGGWDSNRDGVFEGVQHNTYDVEFYGPNPMCSVYYLAALRASEQMAHAAGDDASAQRYRSLLEKGSQWIDANLFNGEFYIQQVRGFHKDQIAPNLRSDMGSEDTEHPEYQVGSGCFVDQLIGQYVASVGGMDPLLSSEHIRSALQSIYRYNYKRSVAHHDNVARTYVLNDEAAVVVCDYGKAERPTIPFPYFSEAWTGIEYPAATLMMLYGMEEQGIEIVHTSRARYDGEKRNPWDEAECGHHYARAMSAWSLFVALSGFVYDGPSSSLTVVPRVSSDRFECFWSAASGWGTFSIRKRPQATQLRINVLHGTLRCRTYEIAASGREITAHLGSTSLQCSQQDKAGRTVVTLAEAATLSPQSPLQIEIRA
ncbi:non-lysosomal glucosylceramidase [Acidicapsa dinghuensis]|uniref:Non-lysosomal glucosylceramidase n=1 Tax=Acidicapsa dinghuensis TaxID=2218256 RepID=A0ABW1EG67_9BACT|nr:non-lysosomal glucosylceramidase [Acidicapsa dinghuensis]